MSGKEVTLQAWGCADWQTRAESFCIAKLSDYPLLQSTSPYCHRPSSAVTGVYVQDRTQIVSLVHAYRISADQESTPTTAVSSTA